MPIVISNSLVLADTPALNANNPVVGWQNILTPASVLADTEDASYPAINLANPSTALFWRGANVNAQNVTVTISQIDPIDYLAVAGHNFGSGGIAAAVEGNAGAHTTHAVALPAGIVAGELLLILVSVENALGATTLTTPTGWTPVFNVAGSGNLRRHAAYSRTADGTEGTAVNVVASLASQWTSNAYRISGQQGAAPEAATATGTASNPDAPNLAPSWGSTTTLWIATAAAESAAASAPSPPASYVSQVNGYNDFGTAFGRMSSAQRQLTAASENPGAFTGSAANWVAATIAVRLSGAAVVTASAANNWVALTQAVIPADDSPLLFRFVSQSLTGVRLALAPAATIPQAAVIYAGALLVLPRRIYVGHRVLPYNRQANVVTGLSETGQFLGRIVLSQTTASALELQHITPAFYRSSIEPWLKSAVSQPFFFAWRPGTYPLETGYCWSAGDAQMSNQLANGMVQASLTLQGIVK